MREDDPEDDAAFTAAIADEVQALRDTKLTPTEYEDLKRTLTSDVVLEPLLYCDCSYLVLGSYGTDAMNQAEKDRLAMVRDTLHDRHPDHHAFLLADLPEFTPNWVVQFVVAARRVDYVIGVFEHNVGGHEFEAGTLTLLDAHELWVLKRAYETTAQEHDHYDGMLNDFFELAAERDQLRTWTSEAELRALAAQEIPGCDTA